MDNLNVTKWTSNFIASLIIGSIVQGIIQTILPNLLPGKPVMPLFPLGLPLGLTIGAIQSAVLRQYFVRAWFWIVATGVGVAVAEVVARFLLHDKIDIEFGFHRSPLPEAITALATVGVTLGISVGSAQCLVLLNAGYRFLSMLWIPATIVGLTGTIAVVDFFTIPEALIFSVLGLLIGLIMGGMIYGTLTGLVLKKLIARKNNAQIPRGVMK